MSIPYLIVDSAGLALAFYKDVFGAEEKVCLTMPDGKIAHAELRLPDGPLMLADEFPEQGYRGPRSLGGSPVSIYLRVDDVDAVFARALAAGASSQMDVADQFDGDRRGSLIDPFGHVWLIATRKEQVSDEDVVRRFAAAMQQG